MPEPENYREANESETKNFGQEKTELSVIIPVFNERTKVERDILAADHFLTREGMTGEIIVVDDGSTDDTVIIARKTAKKIQSECFIELLGKNLGKGCAVRTGILKSRGDYVLFADSGVCVPFSEVKLGLDLISSGQCQIAHGSRKLSGCHIMRPQSRYRKICSKLFHWFLVYDIKRLRTLTDTQCGFKVYRGDIARELYAKSKIERFMFDIEIILLASARGYGIREFAVDWTCDLDSRLKPTSEAINLLVDLMKLKWQFRSPSIKSRH